MTKVIIWTISIITLGAIATAIIWKNPLTPSLKPGDIETSVVDYGPVVKSVPATGVIEPENEVLLLSPASSIITSIFHDVGSRVEEGDVIMQLDDEPIKMQMSK